MAILDGVVVVVVIGLVLLGAAAIRQVKRKATPEISGTENANHVKRVGLRRCEFCRKDTNPDIDLYVDKRWYHIDCYTNKDK